jgi:hypothetical protein
MSQSVWLGLLVFTLFSCGAGKLKPQELFLSPDSGNDKVYIVSAFPQQTDSSGLFLSALLVKHTDEGNKQLTTFVTTYNRSTKQLMTVPFFTDSLLPLDGTRFPLLLKPAITDSVIPSVHFSLDRNSMELTTDYPDGQVIEHTFEFPKQQPFKTSIRGTKFRLSAIKPLRGTLTKWNNVPVNQSGDLIIHTLDNSEPLFEPRSTGNYCWLDCSISGNNYSLFFQYDSLGKITPIYSTFPEGAPHSIEPNSFLGTIKQPGNQVSSACTLKFTTENGFDNVTIQLAPYEQKQVLTKNTFSVRAIDILINNRLTGTGILYIL